MKNSLENKAKFFGQYWGQYVLRFPNNNDYLKLIGWFNFDNGYLELTPLSQITDEDAIEVIRLSSINSDGYYNEFFKNIQAQKQFAEYFFKYRPLFLNEAQQVVDYLRKKGYATTYDGLSVEQLIEYGWVKLKSNSNES